MLSRPPIIVLVRRTSPPPKLSMQSLIKHSQPLSRLTSTTLSLGSLRGARGCGRSPAGGGCSPRQRFDSPSLRISALIARTMSLSLPELESSEASSSNASSSLLDFPSYQDSPVKSRCNRRRKHLHGGRHFDMNSS